MSNANFKNGAADASKGLGPKSESSFSSSQAREQYYAGYKSVKQ